MSALSDYRRAAQAAAASAIAESPGWAFGGAPRALGYLAWGGKSWVTPFASPEEARAYFDRADQLGIDYDYGAVLGLASLMQPSLDWERLGGVGAAAAVSGAEPAEPGKRDRPGTVPHAYARLALLIEQHDAFWSLAARRGEDDAATQRWVAAYWRPWYRRWRAYTDRAIWALGPGQLRQLAREASGGLSWLRQSAEASGVPIPDLGTARRGFAAPAPAPAPAATRPPYKPPLSHQEMHEILEGERTMHHVIGRGGHGGHGGHGGRGGGRRFFGGGGGGGWWPYGWPYAWPYYAQPAAYGSQYDEEEDVVSGRGGRGGGYRHHRRRRRQEQPEDDSQGSFQGNFQGGPQGAPPLYEGDESTDVVGATRRAQIAASPDNELLALLPALAPGAGGICCRMHLGPDLQLLVRICVDGHCYQTQADLTEILHGVAEGVVAAHGRLHDPVYDQMPPPIVAPDPTADMSAHADDAVQTAGLLLVGALYDQHVRTMSAGFWSGLRNVYETVSTPVTWFNKQVAKVLQTPGIKQAVTAAATAVATVYGGPAAGAAAAKFTGPIIDSSAETGGDPLKLFDDAKKHAPNEPAVHQALDHAQRAISETTAAYHLSATAANAAGGDQVAAQKIAQVDHAASQGDPAAVQAMRIIAEVFAQAERNRAGGSGQGGTAPDFSSIFSSFSSPSSRSPDPSLGPPPDFSGPPPDFSGPPPGGDPMPPEVTSEVTSGASLSRWRQGASPEDQKLRAEGMAAAVALHQQTGAAYIGYAKTSGSGGAPSSSGHVVVVEDTSFIQSFASGDEADDWLGGVDRLGIGPILYAAYYDATDPTWPRPVNEMFGVRVVADAVASGLGILPWLALGAAAGGGYAWWRHHRHKAAEAAATAAQVAQAHSEASAAHMPPGAAPATSSGVFLPFALGAAAGVLGGRWWGNRWWGRRLAYGAAHGQGIYRDGKLLYNPAG